MAEKQEKFIREVLGALVMLQHVDRTRWILPSVVIAQAAVESGWNLECKTMFGIKAADGETFTTQEYDYNSDEYVAVEDKFLTLTGVEANVAAYLKLITQDCFERYEYVVCEPNYIKAIDALIHTTDGHPYATSPTYTQTLKSIIEGFELTKYDDLFLCGHYNDLYVRAESDYEKNESGVSDGWSDICLAVIRGEYGNGNERKERLTAAGYDYETVQREVDDYMNTSAEDIITNNGSPSITENNTWSDICLAVIRGEYGNGNERKERLAAAGYNYETVQREVDDYMLSYTD